MKSNYFETILGSIILLFALYGLMIFFQANKSFDNDEKGILFEQPLERPTKV